MAKDGACGIVASIRWVRFLNGDSVLIVEKTNLVFLSSLLLSTISLHCVCFAKQWAYNFWRQQR